MNLFLNLSYLKFFLDAANTGSISESAKRNFVTQSAVSQAITKLEGVLGVPLCLHKKQKFELTEEGHVVLKHAQNIFSSIKDLYIGIDQQREKPQMPLFVLSTHSLGLSLFPNLLPYFAEMHPEISFKFQLGGFSQIRAWLQQGIADFALVLDSPMIHNYSKYNLYQGAFRIYKHKKEKANYQKKGIYIESLQGFMVAEYLQEHEKKYDSPLNIKTELNNWSLIAQYIEKNGGYALLPDFFFLYGDFPSLVSASEIDIAIPYKISAIYPKERKLMGSSMAFLKLLTDHIKNSKN